VFRTIWQLARSEANGVVTFRIATVTRPEPLVEVHTPGLLLAGPPAPVEVRAASPAFALAAADLTAPATGSSERLIATAGQVHGTFMSPAGAQLHALQVRAVGTDGTETVFTHRYRLHQAREGVAQRLAGTGMTRFLAVTVAPDGTVWAGGDAGGRLYRVASDSLHAEFVGTLLDDPAGRVEGVLIDAQGRLQVVVVGPQEAALLQAWEFAQLGKRSEEQPALTDEALHVLRQPQPDVWQRLVIRAYLDQQISVRKAAELLGRTRLALQREAFLDLDRKAIRSGSIQRMESDGCGWYRRLYCRP
jgi:hypothetical protein